MQPLPSAACALMHSPRLQPPHSMGRLNAHVDLCIPGLQCSTSGQSTVLQHQSRARTRHRADSLPALEGVADEVGVCASPALSPAAAPRTAVVLLKVLKVLCVQLMGDSGDIRRRLRCERMPLHARKERMRLWHAHKCPISPFRRLLVYEQAGGLQALPGSLQHHHAFPSGPPRCTAASL
jgi:hypothetical protein